MGADAGEGEGTTAPTAPLALGVWTPMASSQLGLLALGPGSLVMLLSTRLASEPWSFFVMSIHYKAAKELIIN